jgi:hypothetical protein
MAAAAVAAVLLLILPAVLPHLRSLRNSEVLLILLLPLIVGGREVAGLRIPFTPMYYAEAALLVGFLLTLRAQERSSTHLTALIVGLPLFVIFETARAVISMDATQALQPLLQRLGLVEYLLFALVGASLEPPRWRQTSLCLLIAGQVTGLMSILAFLSGAYSLTINGSSRFLSSNQVVVAILALVVLVLKPDMGSVRRVQLAILPFVSVLLVYQRTVWLSALVGITIAMSLARSVSKQAIARSRLQQRLSVILILGGLFVASPWGRGTVDSALQKVTGVALAEDANVAFRLGVQHEQLSQWSHSPVLGRGFSAVIMRPGRSGAGLTEANGHNAWVTITWRAGLLGLTVVVILYGAAIRKALASRTELGAFLASALALIGVGTSFNVWLDVPYLAPLAWLIAGFALGTRRRDDAPDTRVGEKSLSTLMPAL